MAIGTYLAIITLNVNRLNAPIKRYIVTEWIKNKTHICAAYKIWSSDLKTHRLKWRNGKKICYAKGKRKKNVGVAILISDKIDFKTKL